MESENKTLGLYTKYRGDEPVAYRYGEPWVAMQLMIEGGFKTPEEAKKDWFENNAGKEATL